MQKNALFKALGLTFGAVMLAACSSTGDVQEGEAGETQPLAAETADAQTEAADTQAVVGNEIESAQDEADAALREVTTFYFDFDSSTIQADSKNSLIAHATYLAANPGATVMLEGHTDPRGTVEYNLALGERRALSVSRFLQANGAASSQLNTVSFGEERPAAQGNDEAAWSQDRRVVLQYQSR